MNYGVEMIGHNDPAVELQFLMLAAVVERFRDDVATGRRRENRYPIDNRGGDEVRVMFFVNEIATAHE